jgi:hypothetical protein
MLEDIVRIDVSKRRNKDVVYKVRLLLAVYKVYTPPVFYLLRV